jgi:hypothetical protein
VTITVSPESVAEIHHDLLVVHRRLPHVMFLFHTSKELAVVDHKQPETAWLGEQFGMMNYNKTLPKEATAATNKDYPQPNTVNTSQWYDWLPPTSHLFVDEKWS